MNDFDKILAKTLQFSPQSLFQFTHPGKSNDDLLKEIAENRGMVFKTKQDDDRVRAAHEKRAKRRERNIKASV